MGAARVHAESLGDYEASLGNLINPTSDGHWTYSGRLPLDVVRVEVALVFDDELSADVHLYPGCGRAGCVKPGHQEGG